jgi:hypothetical protein
MVVVFQPATFVALRGEGEGGRLGNKFFPFKCTELEGRRKNQYVITVG